MRLRAAARTNCIISIARLCSQIKEPCPILARRRRVADTETAVELAEATLSLNQSYSVAIRCAVRLQLLSIAQNAGPFSRISFAPIIQLLLSASPAIGSLLVSNAMKFDYGDAFQSRIVMSVAFRAPHLIASRSLL